MRFAYSAMSGSCVTRTMVMPCSFSSWNSAITSIGRARVEVAGRLVGEEERRLGDQRARDRDALLLAAGELARLVVETIAEADALERRDGQRAACRACVPLRS